MSLTLFSLSLRDRLRRFHATSERGASAVEYGLLITGVAALIVLVVYALGATLGDLFDETCTSLQTQRGEANCGP